MDKKQVSKLRTRVGWSQTEMARAIGASHGITISHWETGVRVPREITKRFLRLLSDLSDSELRRATKLLEKISDEERSNAKK
jgi:DNA-binding transcriptional regulator YiaG